jgi:MFS family permease
LGYLSQIVTPTPLTLLASRSFIGFCLGVTSAAIMAYAYENQKQIGSFASYGSLGWLFGALAAAAIRDYNALFLTGAIASLLAFLVSMTLSEERTAIRIQVAIFPIRLVKENRKIYFALFARQLGATAIWGVFPLFLTTIGATKLWIAVLDGINMATQFVAMRFLERFDAAKVFRAGLLISTVVFAVYGVTTNYLQLVPAQIFLAIAWSCLFIGALGYLLARSAERGTVSGLLYSTMYLSSGLGPFLGGAVSQLWGFVILMYMGSGLAFVGFLSSKGLRTREVAPHEVSRT